MIHRMWHRIILLLAIIGPGLITAFADNDAGGVATYSSAAAKFGYSILTTMIPITLVLMITQEIGARIAIVTGKGLADLIRERFGIRVTIATFILLFFINFGVILQNIGGLKAGLALFGLDFRIFLPIALIALFVFITMSTYSKIERFFLLIIGFYIMYFISAVLAKPDWGLAAKSLVMPTGPVTFDYLYTSIAVLGTTVTAWGQFFINSYIKDKNITIDKLKYSRLEIFIGAILTNVFSLFMMVAVAATIFANNLTITDAADAARAISPFAGQLAGTLFGLGLIIAGFLGLSIVPLSTAYAFSEFFGFSGSLDESFKKSRLFYMLFIGQILLGTVIMTVPNLQLFTITLIADYFNGIMLPVIFFFLYKLANNEELMGVHKNTKFQNILLLVSGGVITFGAILGGVGKVFGW